ncbi:MAG: dockerin type I repeat-containing protein [Candidatus Thorarchaeota archaeon]
MKRVIAILTLMGLLTFTAGAMAGVPQSINYQGRLLDNTGHLASAYTQSEACCLSDGSCIYIDPVICDSVGGTAQGFGTSCSAITLACCLPDGSCVDVDPYCCDDIGGVLSGLACLGDSDPQDGVDDACQPPYGNDVSVHLNGGEDVVYIGEDNILEIWIANDANLYSFSFGFEINFANGLSWAMDYGDSPPVNRENRATDGPYLLNTHDFDNVSPDHILMGGIGFYLSPGPSELCYSLQFHIETGEPETDDGFSIMPYFYPPAGSWYFQDSEYYPPDFCGIPVSSMQEPVAPPATFDIVVRGVCGDANGDDLINIADGVYIINYIFQGGPPPDPLCVGDASGDDTINVGDAVYLINYIFKGGPAPVEDCCL